MDIITIPILASLDNDNHSCISVAFHPTEPIMATSSDTAVKLWKRSSTNASVTCAATLGTDSGGHSGVVFTLAFHPRANPPLMASGGMDRTIKLWRMTSDNSSATCVATKIGHSRSILSLAFHPTAPIIATGSSDKTIKLWKLLTPDMSDATCVATLDNRDSASSDERVDWVTCVAFHPFVPLMATGSNNHTAKLWQMSSNHSSAMCLATLRGHTKPVNALTFHPTEPILATGSNSVKLWRLSTAATCMATLNPYSKNDILSLAFHPAPNPNTPAILAISSYDTTVQLWRISRDNRSATCAAYLTGHTNSVFSAVFHPTAPILATGSSDRTVKLWDCRQLLSERWQLATVSKGFGGLTSKVIKLLLTHDAASPHLSRQASRNISKYVASQTQNQVNHSRFNENIKWRLAEMNRRFSAIPPHGAVVLPFDPRRMQYLKQIQNKPEDAGDKKHHHGNESTRRGGNRSSKRARAMPRSKKTRTIKKKWFW